ncbi:MAG: ABC transporter ATP-binding protein [Desulfomonilaceae bacterium]
MVRIEHLEVKYAEQWALRGISMEIRQGDLACLIGSNGSGKTTLLNCISGLVGAHSGRILFDGKDIKGLTPDRVCQLGIVQVPEGRKLFAYMTVEENLEMGAYLPRARKRYRENLEKMYRLFPRLQERRRQAAGSLSGGEQQMLAIARGLMACPRFLMLDEPSLGLAPVAAQEIFDIVKELNREGLSILLVSQEVQQSLGLASKAYLMENAKITLHGAASELAQDPRIREAYLGI